ncbi:MAG: ZIP family metal transporter [Lachnospiraceae bacterium]|nr:ZIP family metal transporter [Lachnospiraceae bacterium]
MTIEMLQGIMLPFLGTGLGAAGVFFLKGSMNRRLERALTGFAAGVMAAAGVWSLLIPAMEQSEGMGIWSFVPAIAGFWIGIVFLLALDRAIPYLRRDRSISQSPKNNFSQNTMLVLAVALHNLPEGMAVGVVFAGLLTGSAELTLAGALTLSFGIAIQNIPEGAIISLPLRAEGVSKPKAFLYGLLSGVVEPLGAFLTILAAQYVVPVLPYLLSFSAGAMIYVVVEELIPEMSSGEHNNVGTVMFAAGFSLMMALDVALG